MKKVTALTLLGLFLVVPSIVVAGFLVNDEKKECVVVEGEPGFGIAGMRYSEDCPSGYAVVTNQRPTKAWYVELLESLDRWFGLKKKIIWMPSASQIAFVTSLILGIRRFLQLPLFGTIFDKLTHGFGTIVLTFVASVLTQLSGYLDGGLTAFELCLAVLSNLAGAVAFWEFVKRLVRGGASSG